MTLPDGRRVGELDEEMVYEARPGQVFLLGASSWRIEEIGRDRVIVTPAPGVPGAVPFWKGDGIGRPKELGEAIGRFSRWAVDQSAETLTRDYDLDERAAANLLDYLREQQVATQAIPSDRTIVLERFRDEIGDWRLCILSPYGGRVHAAWGLAISARIRERFGIDGEAIWSDDGIVVRLPDSDPDPSLDSRLDRDPDLGRDPYLAGAGAASYADLVAIDPDEVEQIVVSELGSSALFGARFRENAGRSLLIPRAYPGRRTPLWQQRLKSQALLEVARRYPDFPIVLETYRECLRDVLDLPGLQDLLGRIATRDISLLEVETATASPFAGSLLFDYVATYMYEGDTPTAERRAAALSLDRDLLRELLGQDELRDLIDPAALAQVEDDLQHRSPRTQATGADELSEALRAVGDLCEQEVSERVLVALDASALLANLERERRVIRIRIAGHERLIAADDAGLYRDAFGAAPPGGLPATFLEDVPDALAKIVARYARTHGPFTTAELRARYGLDLAAVLRDLERSGDLVQGELRPGGSEREWCQVDVLRRLRRASLAALRREIEPVGSAGLGRFHALLARRRPVASRRRRCRAPARGARALAGPGRAGGRLGARHLARPLRLLLARLARLLVRLRRAGLGRRGPLGSRRRTRGPLLPRGRPFARAAPLRDAASPAEPEHDLLRARFAASPCFFADLLAEVELPVASLTQALWDLVWAGEVTNDAWAPLRAPRVATRPSPGRMSASLGCARPPALRSLLPALRAPRHRRPSAGSLVFDRLDLRCGASNVTLQGAGACSGPTSGGDPRERRRVLAEILLERYGVLTREQVLAEGIPGGFSSVYPALGELETLGVCRRGYFVEGLGGAQFALPGAVERLRADRSGPEGIVLVLAAVDPAQPFGAALPWPRREEVRRAGRRVWQVRMWCSWTARPCSIWSGAGVGS